MSLTPYRLMRRDLRALLTGVAARQANSATALVQAMLPPTQPEQLASFRALHIKAIVDALAAPHLRPSVRPPQEVGTADASA